MSGLSLTPACWIAWRSSSEAANAFALSGSSTENSRMISFGFSVLCKKINLFQPGFVSCRKMVVIDRFPFCEISNFVANQHVHIDWLLSVAVLSSRSKESMAFKVLHRLLVFLRRSFCLEGAEILSLTRIRILLAGIQPVLTGF